MRLDLDTKSKILGNRYYLHHLVAQSDRNKIFMATDLAINFRKCAIKQMYPSYFPVKMRSKIESAFLHEVEILKKFTSQHAQICQFYNYFTDSGNQYLVQEWIEGTTLEKKLCQQEKLSELETKNILLNLLPTLEYIHSLGIVHNDIKPGNIILRSQDRLPVLIDFGIARKVDQNYGQRVAGTPGYMSLDQAMGKADFNNDFYSLGATAIELLTGKSPLSIDFNSEQENFWQREKTAFDPELVAIIDRAVSNKSDRQFLSATKMRTALQSSEKKLIATSTNVSSAKPKKLEYLISIAVLATSVIWLYLNHSIPQLDSKPPVPIIDSWKPEYPISLPTKKPTPPTALETTNNALQNVIFVPGTTQSTILQALGEPLWRRPGFWANSVAWSYENIVSEGFDIGYIFDSRTNALRQAEIAVPPATDISTVQSLMDSFLATSSTVDIKQGLQAVYQREKPMYNFAIGDLKGVIQRNHKDRIYIAVWSADFHQ